MNYEFHPEAELEFFHTAERYDSEVTGLGARFCDEVERAVQLIQDNPGIGTPLANQIRQFVLGQFPCSILYCIESDCLFILAIAHHRRGPGYWSVRRGP